MNTAPTSIHTVHEEVHLKALGTEIRAQSGVTP